MRKLVATPAILAIVSAIACAGKAPQTPGSASAGACQTSPGDDACDLCTAARCCVEETACMSDAACKTADDALDACEAKAEKAGRGLRDCYDAFGATGSVAQKRAACIRSNCSKECLDAAP